MASKVEGVVDGGMRAEHALNYVRRHGRGAVEPPLKRARRISTPIGSSCAARSIKVSEMTAYGALRPVADHAPAGRSCPKAVLWPGPRIDRGSAMSGR